MNKIEHDLVNAVCSGRSVEFTAEFMTCIPQIIETLAPSVLSGQWVSDLVMPNLFETDDSKHYRSKEVFFQVGDNGGTYYGWYIHRAVEISSNEDDGVEWESFFHSDVGDELFSEDLIERWMYVPVVESV